MLYKSRTHPTDGKAIEGTWTTPLIANT